MNRGQRFTAQSGGWIGAKPTPGIIGVLVGLLLIYFATLAVPEFFFFHLALTPKLALGREPWQLVTSGLVHFKLSALLSSAVTIWLFGTPLEQQRGQARMLVVLLGAVVAGALATAVVGRVFPALVDQPLWGAGAAAMACLASFGVVYGRTPLSLFGAAQMRASTLGWIFIGISVVFYLSEHQYLACIGACSGAAVGALLARGRGIGSMRSTKPGMWLERLRLWRLRRKYRVIDGGRGDRSKHYLN